MTLRFLLYADADSSFYLKQEGETGTRRFGDFLEALDFAHLVTGPREAEVVVYDSTGKLALRSIRLGNGGQDDRKIA